MPNQVISPFHVFTDRNGDPIEAGFIYIGFVNQNPQTAPISVYWDEAMTIPALQPIRTLGGYPSRAGTPAIIYASESDYSITLRDKNGVLVFTSLSATSLSGLEEDLIDKDDPTKGAGIIGFDRVPPATIIDQVNTVGFQLSTQAISPWEFYSLITDKPNPSDPTTWDWQPAMQAAFDLGGLIMLPPHAIRVKSTCTATIPVTLIGWGSAISYVIPDINGTPGGKVFAFETDDVSVENIGIDGTGLATLSTQNHYAFFSGDGTNKYKNHTYRNCSVTNWNFSDGLTANDNLLVSHCFYVDNVDNVTLEDNVVDTASGASFFCRDVIKLTINRNRITDSIWYPIHLAGGCFGFEIAHNLIVSETAGGVFWGGAIDLMSQHIPLEARNRDGVVHHNTIRGTMSYGAAIRALSFDNVWIYNNIIRNWSVGTWAAGPDTTGIRVDTRGTAVDVDNGPVQDCHIFANEIVAPDGAQVHRGIYISNSFQSARTPARGIWVYNNEVQSNSLSSYFANGIIFHGQEGGIEDVHIFGNRVTTVSGGTTPVPGAIGFIATNTQGKIDRVFIGENNLEDIGTPAGSAQVGYAIGQFADNVMFNSPSTVRNYFYGIRTFTSAGPNLYRLNNFISISNTNRNLLGVAELDIYGNAAVPVVASTSSLPIPIFEGSHKVISVTGTTTINSVPAANSTGNAGKTVTLVFAGALIVNDGSNLKLSAAFNPTSADDTLTLACDGTNWYEVARSTN